MRGDSYANNEIESRPSLLETVESYGVALKKFGWEYRGLCPFHSEKTPSFSVNEDKGLFHCFGGCGGGDVFTFIQRIENTDFKGALAHLGINPLSVSRSEITRRQAIRDVSANIAHWALRMAFRLSAMLGETESELDTAGKILNELGEAADKAAIGWKVDALNRKHEILEDFQRDFLDPSFVLSLWNERESLETLFPQLDERIQLPPLSESYRAHLQGIWT